MVVHVLSLWRVVLHDRFLRPEEQVLDGAHLLPGGADLPLLVAGRHAHMVPTAVVAGNTEKRSTRHKNLEDPVPAIPLNAVNLPFELRLPICVKTM